MEKDFVAAIKGKHIDLIVVSDSEAILGIGGALFHNIPSLEVAQTLVPMFS